MSEYNRSSLSAVFAAGVGLALAFGTVIIATFGLFLIAMAREFGWGMTQTSGLLGCAALFQAPLSLIVGRQLDRIGVRRIVLPGILLYGGSIMLLATANGSTLQIYGLFALVGITSSLVTMVPYSKIVSAWFSRKRGLMLSVYAIIAALLGSAVPQAARLLIDGYGWRNAYLALGAGVIVIGFPTLYALLREPADDRRQAPPPPLAVGMTARQVRATPTYWAVVAAIGLLSLAIQAVHAHLAPLLVERGLTRLAATNALSIFTLTSIAAQLAMGAWIDRSASPRPSLPILSVSLAGLLILYAAPSAPVAVLGGALLGMTVGAEISLAKFLHARYFGNRAFGEVFGLQFLFIGLSAAVGPVVMGALHDATGDYRLGLLLVAGLILFSLALIARLPRYDAVRPPLRQPDEAAPENRASVPLLAAESLA